MGVVSVHGGVRCGEQSHAGVRGCRSIPIRFGVIARRASRAKRPLERWKISRRLQPVIPRICVPYLDNRRPCLRLGLVTLLVCDPLPVLTMY